MSFIYNCVLVFICLLFVKPAVSSKDFVWPSTVAQHNYNAYSIANCMLHIPHIQFTTVLFLSNTNIKDVEMFGNDMIEIFARHSIPVMISKDLRYIEDEKKINTQETLVVLHVNDCNGLSNIDVGFIKTNIKYVLIIHDYSDAYCQTKLVGVPSKFARYNVVFIVPESNGIYKILSYVPQIDGGTCDYSTLKQPEHINTCTHGYLEGAVVFRNKTVTDMKRCTLRVSATQSIPHVSIGSAFPDLFVLEPLNVTGMDIEIIKIVAEKYNTSIYCHLRNVFKNAAIRNDIASNRHDVEIGGFIRYEFSTKGILNTVTYSSTDIVWIYTVRRTERDWKELATRVNGLYLFGLFHIIYVLIFNFIRYIDGDKLSFSDTFLYSWGALLGTNSLQNPRSFKQSILNMFYLYMCVHLSAYVSTQLSAFLAVGTPSRLFKTHEEIINSDINSYFHPRFLNSLPTEEFRAFGLSSPSCVTAVCEPMALANDGAALTFEDIFYTLPVAVPVNGEARMLKTQKVFFLPIDMDVAEYSIFAESILKTVERLVETGITPKLLEDSMGLGVKARVDHAMRVAATNDYSCESGCRIAMKHLWPAFFVWLLGCSFAACAFVVELLWKKYSYILTF